MSYCGESIDDFSKISTQAMSTYEERLTTLEKNVTTLQKKTTDSIVEIDENTTILLGVIRRQGQDIRLMSERLETLDQRVERLETILNEHTNLLTQILERLPKQP